MAGVIAVAGVCLIALPTGIFAASFSDAMERHQKTRKPRSGSDG